MCLDSSFSSVHPLPAFRSAAVAGCLVLALRTVQLVVETQLEDRRKGRKGQLRKEAVRVQQRTLTSSPLAILRTQLMMIL